MKSLKQSAMSWSNNCTKILHCMHLPLKYSTLYYMVCQLQSEENWTTVESMKKKRPRVSPVHLTSGHQPLPHLPHCHLLHNKHPLFLIPLLCFFIWFQEGYEGECGSAGGWLLTSTTMFILLVNLAVAATRSILTADASSLSFMSSTNNGFSAGSVGTSSSLLPINRIVTPCQQQYSFKGTYFNQCLKPPIMIFSNRCH